MLTDLLAPTTTLSAAPSFAELLQASAVRHQQLCPRQVLGVRMGLWGMQQVDLPRPNSDKRLLVIIETDGCFADGIAAATGCSIGARTLRVIDQGKVAAVFVDVQTHQAIRIVPQSQARERAARYAPAAPSKWHAQRDGYQLMPDEELFTVRSVNLTLSVEQLLSKPGSKAVCRVCGEEIINEREVRRGGDVLCRACAGESYWRG